jgi:hypothetical protein
VYKSAKRKTVFILSVFRCSAVFFLLPGTAALPRPAFKGFSAKKQEFGLMATYKPM